MLCRLIGSDNVVDPEVQEFAPESTLIDDFVEDSPHFHIEALVGVEIHVFRVAFASEEEAEIDTALQAEPLRHLGHQASEQGTVKRLSDLQVRQHRPQPVVCIICTK